MDITFLIKALALVSVLTTLTVEAIKKVLASLKKDKCNATILAVIMSAILSVGSSVCYIIYNSLQVNAQVIIEIIILVFLSFLCSTVGYDKVVKEIFEKLTDKK